MTKREYFDLLLKTNNEGGFPSTDGAYCMYRNPHGRKCVYGLLIPDNEYDPRWEGKSVKGLNAAGFKIYFVDGLTIHDLADIQKVHDYLCHPSFKTWEADMFEHKIRALPCFKEFSVAA